jgi:hypothetical protein
MAMQEASDETYRAIGRFVFEFSQVEYMIRYFLAQEIQLKEEYFSAVVESYDVGVLINVAKEVFKKNAACRQRSHHRKAAEPILLIERAS